MNRTGYRGRIAPSPTGFLHLGHAKTFWTAFERCRRADGILVYRDEDIDEQRCRPEYSQAAVEDLTRLGISWQEGPYHQSKRLDLYRAVLAKLHKLNCIYPCRHSRKAIEQHPESARTSTGEIVYPLSLRPSKTRNSRLELNINWRFRAPRNRKIEFKDQCQGTQSFTSQVDFGDFLVWRKEGMPSYELAVVVDDVDMRITEVVRGADLLVSTARQILLFEMLGSDPPAFYHTDLVKDERGERLAKRNDSLALRALFEKGLGSKEIQSLWQKQS